MPMPRGARRRPSEATVQKFGMGWLAQQSAHYLVLTSILKYFWRYSPESGVYPLGRDHVTNAH